jgi:hypothetical protein
MRYFVLYLEWTRDLVLGMARYEVAKPHIGSLCGRPCDSCTNARDRAGVGFGWSEPQFELPALALLPDQTPMTNDALPRRVSRAPSRRIRATRQLSDRGG